MTSFISFFIGTVFGSFFGLVIDRLPAGQSIVSGRSHCTTCRHVLRPWEMIPILSQLVSGSRCWSCKVKLPLRYAVIELLTGLIFLATWQGWIDFPVFLTLIMSLILGSFDKDSQSFPLIVWLIFAAFFILFVPERQPQYLWLVIALLAQIKDIKIGAGDFLWLFLASYTLSFMDTIWVIQVASLLGILVYLVRKQPRVAFIPYLATGYLIVLVAGQILSL